MLLPFAVKAQDTTNVSITDSSRMYRYVGVYAVINSISILPPSGLRLNADSTKWLTSMTVLVYTSKNDYRARKPELFGVAPAVLKTDLYPTRLEILTRMRTVIK